MSSTFSPAETLRKHRPLLLAMEATGWFHMAGKARVEFLRKHGGDKVQYEERRWHNLETPPFPWDTLLEWVKRLYGSGIPSNAWPGTFAAFTERHADRNPGLLGLLQAAHGIVSGVEKNLPASTSGYLNQSVCHMWLSSPWGHPKRNLLVDPTEILTPQGWRQLVAEIRRILEEARRLGAGSPSADVHAWQHWREQAIGPASFIRRAFLSTLAETRLPNNEVTLWDQSYVAAALFKSAVAGALLASTGPQSSFPWTKDRIRQIAQNLGINLSALSNKEKEAYLNGFLKSNTRWRLLTVVIGTEHYEARSVKIGDWTGAQGAIEEFFRQVATLMEVDLGVGWLLYRDSSVAVFSFPGERFDEEEHERKRRNDASFRYDENNFAPWLINWRSWLEEQINAIAENLDLETPPAVRLSAPTRSLVRIVKERREIRKIMAVPIHCSWNIRWRTPEEARGHVCPVCRVRLNGAPSSKTKPCRVCQRRRHHRRDDWLQGKLGYDTIWFEEVADRNNRLALLTFSLDLEPWLSGERVDSLRAQAIPEWTMFNPVLEEFWQRDVSRRSKIANPIQSLDLMSKLISEIKQKFRDPSSGDWQFPESDIFLANLQEGFRHTRRSIPQRSHESRGAYEERLWRTFYQQIVEDRADTEEWNNLQDDERAAWLAHQLFRKLPSPGRVYRFWREAEEFFHDLLREFRQIASRSDNPWRVRRLVLVPKDENDWQDLTLYDGRWRDAQISLVYVQSLGGFVTASNLARLLRPEEAKEVLQGEPISLEEEDRFGSRRTVEVENVRDLSVPHSHLGVYAPVIPVEISPLRFRVLVPLEVASECVDLALKWWKERFARVWDRLPLQVGVLGFPGTLPYQAVVEATRNVEDALNPREPPYWRVVKVEKQSGAVALYLRHDAKEILRVIPIAMPDGREDVFYPYLEVEDRKLRFPKDFRHPDSRIFRHAVDLRPGDGVKVVPARVLTLFMDSTAARFRVGAPRLLDEWQHMRETWELLKRVAPSQTALQRLRSDLAQVESAWRTPQGEWEAPEDLRWDTYKALLAHHLDVSSKNALESLTHAAMRGWLTWALDWHITVLKESL